MTLSELQRRFHADVTAPDEGSGSHSGSHAFAPAMQAGLDVYRQGYRARMLEALAGSYARVQALVGEESFAAAAAHHLILHPPSGWSLDNAGIGFEQTLASLFPNDPEVAELAWLEWEMQQLFVCADETVLSPQQFAGQVQACSEEDWQQMRLELLPCLQLRWMHSNCAASWEGAATGTTQTVPAEPSRILLWRRDLDPCFRRLEKDEAEALILMQDGGSFGDMCEMLVARSGAQGIQLAGEFLGRWVEQGLIKGLHGRAGNGDAAAT